MTNSGSLINKAQIQCLAVFSLFAIIGFGPISPGCLIGMFVVLFRPLWFWQLAVDLYAGKPTSPTATISAEQSKQARKKCFLGLLTLFIIDIAPVPVTPTIAFVIILARPEWFYRLIASIYQTA
jgi:hypothetical protein